MSNDNNRDNLYGDNRVLNYGKTKTIKGVGTTKVTRDKFSENKTTYTARKTGEKRQGE
ncbi:hypothetical protein [Bacillus mycoides]|uniref:hypothetical protein n=1 Tax=Bacillus mycoides TaxID=1405 RepID=UPI002733D32B|nr:hypothetical protein [Bacillus mycoides]